MDVDSDPQSWLALAQSNSTDSSVQLINQLTTAYNKKLWHNVTVLLLAFVNHPETAHLQVSMFNSFVRDFESKINPLRLVEIARKVSTNLDPKEALAFLESLHSRLAVPFSPPPKEGETATAPPPPPAAEAYSLSLSSIAYAKLLDNDVEGTKKAIDESQSILDRISRVEGVVNAGFYGVSADYYKVKADYAPYYKTSLLYLACIPLAELSEDDKVARAHDLSIAALLGEGIYNFGELLQHPILASLDSTAHAWIKSLLFVFNSGDIGKFESMLPHFDLEPILAGSSTFLRQKICLMALIESVFKRPTDERVITFQSIAEETKVPAYEVEILIIRALSLKLIKGSLDQISETLSVTWVQPRVLDRNQLEALSSRLSDWVAKVGGVGEYIGERGSALAAN